MSKIQELVTSVINAANNKELHQDQKESFIATSIRHFVDDILEVKNNIDNTSLGPHDYRERCMSASKFFGINERHLINK